MAFNLKFLNSMVYHQLLSKGIFFDDFLSISLVLVLHKQVNDRYNDKGSGVVQQSKPVFKRRI